MTSSKRENIFSKCKNGATCKQEKDTYKCECVEGTAGRFCEEKVDIAKFDKEERFEINDPGKVQNSVFFRLEREVCIRNRCNLRSGDGQCDLDCNLAACDFDGGDCSAKLQPFANCRFASYCAKSFANRICDKVSIYSLYKTIIFDDLRPATLKNVSTMATIVWHQYLVVPVKSKINALNDTVMVSVMWSATSKHVDGMVEIARGTRRRLTTRLDI